MPRMFEFLYFGILAYIYSIVVQTPVAFLYWGMDTDQYIHWAAAGLPLTILAFGWPLKKYLDWCGKFIDKRPE